MHWRSPLGKGMTARMSSPGLILRGASLAYAGTLLFDRLDLTLAGGETTCILGPSGVGKSSLLRLVAGLAHGAAGAVAADDGRPLAGRLAWMAQSDLLLPWLTVSENVALGARLRRRPGDRERVGALLAGVGLAAERDLRPAALSGGMRQRVALARTLYEDRPIVLMDEPFSALDAVTRLTLQDLAARLLQDRTVVMVTHDPMEALRLGHRLLVLAGRPARLIFDLRPEHRPPRDVRDADLLRRQADLLEALRPAEGAGR